MTVPKFPKKLNIPRLKLHQYERYLPTAFDESLTLLEKVNKIIHYIGEYTEVTNDLIDLWNELVEWIKNEGLEELVNKKLEEWLEDGTLYDLFIDDIIDMIQELLEKADDIIAKEYEFDYTQLEPTFIMNLGGLRNAVNQSINIDLETNQLFVTQSDSKTPEGFYITRLTPSGHYIDAMWIPNGGHGTMIGLDRRTNGDLKIWAYHTGKNKLIQFEYEGNKVLTESEVDLLTDFTPQSLGSTYFTPYFDPYFDYLVFRRDDGIVEIRSREEVRNKIDNVLYSVKVDDAENGGDRPMQGCVTYGTKLYWQSGAADNPMKIQLYDAETGEKLKDYTVQELTAEDGKMLYRDDFKEPEGLAYFVNPKTGKHSLLFVITTGGIEKRYHMLYAINQRHANEHWFSMGKLGTQNYAFTRGDGRALSVPDGTTHLNQITKPGIYYISAGQANSIGGFPFVLKDTGWYLVVKPLNQTLDGMQKLIRFTTTLEVMEFHRNFRFDRENFTYEFGEWSKTLKGSPSQEYLDADAWGNRLTNVLMGGEYYITSPQADAFQDFPNESAGFRLYVSNPDSDGQVMQTLVRNSSTHFQVIWRRVNKSTKVATDWAYAIDRRYDAGMNVVYATRVTPSQYGNLLANIRHEGEYYITTTELAQFTDAPGSVPGWLKVSKATSDGRVIQTFTINQKDNFHVYRRMVERDGTPASNWQMYNVDSVFAGG